MFASYDPDDPLLQLIETGMVYFKRVFFLSRYI